jgi:hypothetical protein
MQSANVCKRSEYCGYEAAAQVSSCAQQATLHQLLHNVHLICCQPLWYLPPLTYFTHARQTRQHQQVWYSTVSLDAAHIQIQITSFLPA